MNDSSFVFKRAADLDAKLEIALDYAERGGVLYLSLNEPLSAVICSLHIIYAKLKLRSSPAADEEMQIRFLTEPIDAITVVDCPLAATVETIEQRIIMHMGSKITTVIIDDINDIMKSGGVYSPENRLEFAEAKDKLMELASRLKINIVLLNTYNR